MVLIDANGAIRADCLTSCAAKHTERLGIAVVLNLNPETLVVELNFLAICDERFSRHHFAAADQHLTRIAGIRDAEAVRVTGTSGAGDREGVEVTGRSRPKHGPVNSELKPLVHIVIADFDRRVLFVDPAGPVRFCKLGCLGHHSAARRGAGRRNGGVAQTDGGAVGIDLKRRDVTAANSACDRKVATIGA